VKQQTLYPLALSSALVFLLTSCGASPPTPPPAPGLSGDGKPGCAENSSLADCGTDDGTDGGTDGSGGTKPPAPLPAGFKVSELSLASGHEVCVKGGDGFVTFYDKNGNGAQDGQEEIVQKHYFCPKKGNPLPPSLDDAVQYAAIGKVSTLKLGDSRCIFGGKELTVFIDVNSNLAFDADEPSHQVAHCNAIGSSSFTIHGRPAGADYRSLPRGHDECENGGAEIFSYIDIDESNSATGADFAFEVNYLCLTSDNVPKFNSSEVASVVGKGHANCPADGGIEVQRPMNGKKIKKLYTCSNPDFGPAPVAEAATFFLRRGETEVRLYPLQAKDPSGFDVPDRNFIFDPPPATQGTLTGSYPNIYFVPKDPNFRGRYKLKYHVISEGGAKSKDATITIIVQRTALLVSQLNPNTGSMFENCSNRVPSFTLKKNSSSIEKMN
jgi:hypothetical protein